MAPHPTQLCARPAVSGKDGRAEGHTETRPPPGAVGAGLFSESHEREERQKESLHTRRDLKDITQLHCCCVDLVWILIGSSENTETTANLSTLDMKGTRELRTVWGVIEGSPYISKCYQIKSRMAGVCFQKGWGEGGAAG